MNLRRVAVALVVGVLVANAGCSGFSDGGQPATETTTATTTEPATDAATETTGETTTAAEQVAPGVTSEGVTDALALADAHLAHVQNEPFVKHVRVEESNATASAYRETMLSYANESAWRWRVSAEGMPLALDSNNGTFVQYADGEKVLWRLEANGSSPRENVTYGVRAVEADGDRVPVPPEQLFPAGLYDRSLVYTLFGNADVTVEHANESAVRVRGTSNELTLSGEQVMDVEFTATVAADGLVESIDLSYEQGDTTVEQTVCFDARNSDPVQRPDWYETAENRTGT